MIKIRRQPTGRGVTIIAGITTRDMRWVFSGSGNTVVTGSAGTENLGMVDGNDRLEGGRVMAVFANVCRLNMYGTFPGRTHAVVTADAVARNTRVIKNSRNPGRGRVAIIALITGGNMRECLAGRLEAIMTGHAASRQ